MAPVEHPPAVDVEVAYAEAPHVLHRARLQLPVPATVAQALQACPWWQALSAEQRSALQPGVWGRACAADAPLREGDRVELTRALRVDPKEARRQRYRRDGLRRAPRSAGSGCGEEGLSDTPTR